MEGPTPVSALIHAATMVTAGVYLICRMHPFFDVSQTASITATVLGTVTLLVAATTALVQTDLKRIIAYSTMSQIGYMIAGAGAAAYSASMFHLMTHAFFKALLFMSAGSVIAAMGGVQDVNKMGGFKKAMPFTYAAFTIGAITLAGFPFLSAFFSKDEIIGFTLHRGGGYVYIAIAMYIGALLTAFYSMRMVFLVFHGDKCEEAAELEGGHIHHGDPVNPSTGEIEPTTVGYPGPDHQIAEREGEMKVAMGTLAFLAIFAGLLQVPGVTDVIEKFLAPVFDDSKVANNFPSVSEDWTGLAIGATIALLGIGICYWAYMRDRGVTGRVAQKIKPVYGFLLEAWRFDALYDRAIVQPMAAFARFCNNVIERYVVDGIVDGTTHLVRAGAHRIRELQSGLVRGYAMSVIGGVTLVAFYFYVVAR
jgi:NADH-quinone oxidoreductase subunit L